MNKGPFALTLFILAAPLPADEGMWTFDNPPRAQLQERYGFGASAGWLDQLRLSSVRFMDGGSGSFVSGQGLLLTNHHVGRGCIQNVSSKENDYMARGFLAESRAKELPCPGYEVNVLTSYEEVSIRVQGATRSAATDQASREARKAEIARLEDDCARETGLRCDVVTLYEGGEYWLYRYKKYTDVRLVFAPEGQIAFFGGDPDNFTYPRFDLDICFLRAYEGGHPAKPAAFLEVAPEGAREGDLVFVSGHPGSTSRLLTVAQLEAARDHELPEYLAFLARRLRLLREFGARSPESERRAQDDLFSLSNAEKALTGRLTALQDQAELARLAAAEKALREKVAADSALREAAGSAWEIMRAATGKSIDRLPELRYAGFQGSHLLGLAAHLVRLPVETRKPTSTRFEEYVDAGLPSLKNRLFSSAPVHADLEEATLADQLALALEKLGPEHPFVKAALLGRTPADAARAALEGTRLFEVAARQALFEGGEAAVAASTDSMVDLARRIDPVNRQIRTWYETEVDAPRARAAEKIAAARFAVLGKTVSPDATFTLRLSPGQVKGFPAEGTEVPAYTTFFGLYDRSAAFGGRAPWNLPARWVEKRASLALETPLNFVATNDIIGGNSGSPVVDRQGRFVGVAFDINIWSLAWDYYYSEARGRAVHVDVRGILEALRKVYGAEALVRELLGS